MNWLQKISDMPYAETDKIKVHDITFDNWDGIGAVPDNMNVVYKGFVIMMKPSEFMRLAEHGWLITDPGDYVKSKKTYGTPWLSVVWENNQWKVVGHEGRHRVLNILSQGDVPIPVQIFPSGQRARHMTKEKVYAPMVPEEGGLPFVPSGQRFLNGEEI